MERSQREELERVLEAAVEAWKEVRRRGLGLAVEAWKEVRSGG